jgi:hypothetical protein
MVVSACSMRANERFENDGAPAVVFSHGGGIGSNKTVEWDEFCKTVKDKRAWTSRTAASPAHA